MRLFKKSDGTSVDVVKYTKKIMGQYPQCEIRVGTDSQTHRTHIRYVTVVAYRWGTRGVHLIYNKEKLSKKGLDRYNRLYIEAVKSIELAEYLKKNGVMINAIDMDYNGKLNTPSNKLIGPTKGWAEGLGYKVYIKPDSQIATKAADELCR